MACSPPLFRCPKADSEALFEQLSGRAQQATTSWDANTFLGNPGVSDRSLQAAKILDRPLGYVLALTAVLLWAVFSNVAKYLFQQG